MNRIKYIAQYGKPGASLHIFANPAWSKNFSESSFVNSADDFPIVVFQGLQ